MEGDYLNAPEKIVQAYLRLNGFFTIPYFSVLQEPGTHIDFLAVRLGGSVEEVGTGDERTRLKIDEEFLAHLGMSMEDTVGLVVEVKGGAETAQVDEAKLEYATSFFGDLSNIFRVGFERRATEIHRRDDHAVVPIARCLSFIDARLKEVEKLDNALRGEGRMTKEGSWHLSEEFLSDILYLKKLRRGN